MPPLGKIRAELTRRSIAKVSRQTGLGYQTIYRIARGYVTNPRYSTLLKLAEHLEIAE